MKTYCLAVLIFVFAGTAVLAQSVRYSTPQPYISLSAYSKLHTDALSFTGNQASLAQVKQWSVGIYGERKFMMKEAGAYTLAASVPARLGNFGVQVNYAGFKNFNENRIGLAYARRLGRSVDLGVQFNYYSYRIPSYGNATALNFEMGALIHLSEELHSGIHVYNPVGGKLGKNMEEKLASVYKFGLGYDASPQLFIGAEVLKEEDKPVNVIAGFQYQFASQFFVRAGVLSETMNMFAGAGVAWKKLRLDINSAYHPQLGLSPGLLLLLNFKANKK